jgi:hypothetical protein
MNQQQTESDAINSELLVQISSDEPVLTATEDHVLEQEHLENVQTLLDESSSETKRRNRLRWLISGAMTGGALTLLGSISFLIPRVSSGNLWLLPVPSMLALLIPCLACIPLTSLSMRPSKKQQTIIDCLIAGNDVRSVGPLLNGLGTSSKVSRGLMVRALISQLPRLQESDNVWLSDANHRGLLALVQWANSGIMRKYYGDRWDDLVVASVQALSDVGDSRALKPIEALATGNTSTEAGKRIQLAARDCLEQLRKRVDRYRVGQHLLRSSAEPDLQGDMLLKPVAETSNAYVQELPRPSGPN